MKAATAGKSPATPRPAIASPAIANSLDPEGYPAVAPPWGTLNAIDLNTGKYLWTIPFGEYPELAAKGMTNTGTENYGGPYPDRKQSAVHRRHLVRQEDARFDATTGKLQQWQATLPFAGNATPITYMAGGRQFVLIQTDNARDKKAPQGLRLCRLRAAALII